ETKDQAHRDAQRPPGRGPGQSPGRGFEQSGPRALTVRLHDRTPSGNRVKGIPSHDDLRKDRHSCQYRPRRHGLQPAVWPLDTAGKIFEDGFEWDKPLHLGGPVPGPLMVLHAIEEMADQVLLPGIGYTLEASRVQEIIRERPEPSLVIANYSGWGPGQLEGEFGWDSWLTLPAKPEHVFWSGEKELWKVVVN